MILENLLVEVNRPMIYQFMKKALWWAGKGNWDKAHDLIQDVEDKQASLIHAYLHRYESDISNAHYWYTKADAKMPDQSLEIEWEVLVKKYLGTS
jgi:hypothetical protein